MLRMRLLVLVPRLRALELLAAAPFGPSVLEPGFHLAIGETELLGQVLALLRGEVLGAGEICLQIASLLPAKAYLDTASSACVEIAKGQREVGRMMIECTPRIIAQGCSRGAGRN